MSTESRQGRISGWLKMNQASVSLLAKHLDLSVGRTSVLCNLPEVPTSVLSAMKTFQTPTKKHIPISYLPKGKDKARGPQKGWLDRKLEAARQGGSVSDAV